MTRTPIQITSPGGVLYALCDDGSLWALKNKHFDPHVAAGQWKRLPNIPQERAKVESYTVEQLKKRTD